MDARGWIVLAGWLVGWWLLWRLPWLGAGGAGSDGDAAHDGDDARDGGVVLAPSCSVVIPARDEEGSLPALLASLARQTVRPGQVLVVDDQSTDRTAALAREHGVTVIAGEPVPPGWTGKAWACEQGARAATGDVLVFLDADVVLEPPALGAVLGELGRRGGLVSVQPYHQMRRAYERLSAMFNLIGFMGVGSASPGRDASATGAFGPLLATRRADYERAGRHEAVRGDIVEDVALARRYRRVGLPVHAFGGGDVVRFRMYPDGLGQLVEGWSKNIATGASTVQPGRLLLVGFWLTCVLVTVQSLIEAVFGLGAPGWPQVVGGYVLFAVQIGAMLRQVGNFGPLTAALYPGPVGIFLVVFARSVWLTLVRRKVTWRGRAIPLSRSRRWSGAPVPSDE